MTTPDLETVYRAFAASLGDVPESYDAAQAFLDQHPDSAAEFWPLSRRRLPANTSEVSAISTTATAS